MYSLVVNSCARHDLLQRTLESFVACVDIFPLETIIVEDSPTPRPDWLNYPQLGIITWLQNTISIGQAASIDKAYAEVKHELLFHLEDDWAFLQPGSFITESASILEKYPTISTVTLTNHKGWMVEDPNFSCLLNRPSAAGLDAIWDGITFNPGLRRLSDYKKLGETFASILGRPGCPEADVASRYRNMGYVMADLGVRYVTHTGNDRRCEATC